MAFDFQSSVAVEEPDQQAIKDTGLPTPPVTVSPPFEFESSKLQEDVKSEIPLSTPKPLFQKITDFALNPVAEAAKAGMQFGVDKGFKDWKEIDFLPLADDTNKSRDSQLMAGVTGLPQADIEQHYDGLKALYNFTSRGLAGGAMQAGVDLGKRVDPVTTLGVFNAVMTPAVIAGAVANPGGTAATLLAFSALDMAIPTSQFITQEMTKSQAASVELIGLLAKGAIVGGVFHAGEKMTDLSHIFDLRDMQMADLMEQHTYQKLQSLNLPEIITLAPDALEKIWHKQAIRLEATKARAEAIARAVSDEPLPGDVNLLGDLGIDNKTAENAITNGLAVKVKAERLVKVALRSPEDFQIVADSVKKAETKVAQIEAAPADSSKSLVETQKSALSVDQNKDSGLAKSIEAKAIEQGMVSKGFDKLSGYESTTLKEQSELSADIINKGDEYLMNVLRGEEPMPSNLRGFSLIIATEKYLLKKPNPDLAYELANSPLVTMVSEAASELSAGQNRVQDSATARLQEVKKARTEKAQKLTKETPRKIQKMITDETKKVNLSKAELSWDKLLKEIEC